MCFGSSAFWRSSPLVWILQQAPQAKYVLIFYAECLQMPFLIRSFFPQNRFSVTVGSLFQELQFAHYNALKQSKTPFLIPLLFRVSLDLKCCKRAPPYYGKWQSIFKHLVGLISFCGTNPFLIIKSVFSIVDARFLNIFTLDLEEILLIKVTHIPLW